MFSRSRPFQNRLCQHRNPGIANRTGHRPRACQRQCHLQANPTPRHRPDHTPNIATSSCSLPVRQFRKRPRQTSGQRGRAVITARAAEGKSRASDPRNQRSPQRIARSGLGGAVLKALARWPTSLRLSPCPTCAGTHSALRQAPVSRIMPATLYPDPKLLDCSCTYPGAMRRRCGPRRCSS